MSKSKILAVFSNSQKNRRFFWGFWGNFGACEKQIFRGCETKLRKHVKNFQFFTVEELRSSNMWKFYEFLQPQNRKFWGIEIRDFECTNRRFASYALQTSEIFIVKIFECKNFLLPKSMTSTKFNSKKGTGHSIVNYSTTF